MLSTEDVIDRWAFGCRQAGCCCRQADEACCLRLHNASVLSLSLRATLLTGQGVVVVVLT
jgi:hypothetical protein